MTWAAAVYALLALVLAGGFAWYERSRPPARMVALVAALAALAIAGRLAFAAIPNVVATTDIVLITGYSVGAAPGFAVGALAAAVSNLWLGQGPWTPWQMAGWGLVGVAGAALAIATGRRLGRVGLAVACGLAGLAYGALLDLSVMVTYGGEQSFDRYLAISARGIPFNVAHAVGNVALALAAGPALVRMISRYRSRFEFTWREAGAVPLAVLAVAAAFSLPISGAGASGTATAGAGGGAARDWLEGAQNPDGGFGAEVGGESSVAMTGWAVLGLEAAGRNPRDVRNGGSSALGYLRANVASVRSTGDLERTLLVLAGAGANPHRFGGRDLVAELRNRRSPSGSYEGQVNLTAFGILALRAGGAPHSSVSHAAAWLREAQNSDGGWGFQPQATSDADSSGAALQGLAAGGKRGAAVRHGSTYLVRVQDRDGGFALAGNSGSNSQSTAWAVQGLVAAGGSPAAMRKRGRSPLDYLADRQAGDGHYRYSSSSDQTPVWVTGQALLAVKRKAFPLAAVPRSAPRASPSPVPEPRSHSPSGHQGSQAPRAGAPATAAPASGGAPSGRASKGRARTHEAGHKRDLAVGPGRSAKVSSAGTPASAPIAPPAAPADEGGGPGTTAYLGAGLGVAAVLAAGFLWYRRRLS